MSEEKDKDLLLSRRTYIRAYCEKALVIVPTPSALDIVNSLLKGDVLSNMKKLDLYREVRDCVNALEGIYKRPSTGLLEVACPVCKTLHCMGLNLNLIQCLASGGEIPLTCSNPYCGMELVHIGNGVFDRKSEELQMEALQMEEFRTDDLNF